MRVQLLFLWLGAFLLFGVEGANVKIARDLIRARLIIFFAPSCITCYIEKEVSTETKSVMPGKKSSRKAKRGGCAYGAGGVAGAARKRHAADSGSRKSKGSRKSSRKGSRKGSRRSRK